MRTPTALLLATLAGPAHAETGTVTLPVTFAGLPVGTMEYSVKLEGDRYTIDGEGATGGIGKLASKASSTFRSRGRVTAERPVPRSHSVSYRDGKKEGAAAIKFRGGRVISVSETPPPTPRKDRIEVTAAMLRGVMDPTSAMIVPAAASADLATVCNRTLKISDARNVFTLALSPEKSGRLADGTPTHTCKVRYKALGGHRESSRGVKRFERNRTLRITFAPLAASGKASVWGLVGFTMKTRFGRVRGTAAGVDGV